MAEPKRTGRLAIASYPVDNSVFAVANALDEISRAYDRLTFVDDLTDRLLEDPAASRNLIWPFRTRRSGGWPPHGLFNDSAVRATVGSQDRLLLASVRLESPGFWEFLGRLNPLEVLRLSINDWHERRKDREWREAREARAMDLENKLRETELVGKVFDLGERAGASEAEMRGLFDEYVGRPLLDLDPATENGNFGQATLNDERRLSEGADSVPEDRRGRGRRLPPET